MLDGLGIGLIEAALFSVRNYRAGSSQVPSLADAAEQFLATRNTLSVSFQKSLRNTLHRFSKFTGKKDLGLVKSGEIEAWLMAITEGRAPKTWNTLAENLQAFFNWAVQKGWILHSPAAAIEKKKVVRQLPVVLRPQQAEALLNDVEANYPEFVPYFVLALFGGIRAGIREGECSRLDESLRDGKSPIVSGGIRVSGKTGRERIVPWNEPMRKWLDTYPIGDCLLPGGEHAADAIIAAIRKKHKLAHNVLRHTGITGMALATDSIVGTAIACDTSETMIRKHYLGQWDKRDALCFYSIRPSEVDVETEHYVLAEI
jgi:site-specific recombinase XerD